jgi:hypothetical protein
MADSSFLDWPFFEPRHRELAEPHLMRGARPTCPLITRIPMPRASGW